MMRQLRQQNRAFFQRQWHTLLTVSVGAGLGIAVTTSAVQADSLTLTPLNPTSSTTTELPEGAVTPQPTTADLLTQAHDACLQAKALRTTDLPAAEAEIERYRTLFATATASSADIMAPAESRQGQIQAQCNEIQASLNRVKAFQLLQSALRYCDDAQERLAANDQAGASDALADYENLRTTALETDASVANMHAMQTRLQACSTTFAAILPFREEQARWIARVRLAEQHYQQGLLLCQNAEQYFSDASNLFEQAELARTVLINARAERSSARSDAGLFTELEQQPKESLQGLKQLVTQFAACDGKVADILRRVEKQRYALETRIEAGNQSLQSSLNACESALADTAPRREQFNLSARLKRNIIGDSELIQIVRQYTQWPASQDFINLMRSTQKCQQALAAQLRRTAVSAH